MGFLLFILTGFFLFQTFHFYRKRITQDGIAESYFLVIICLSLLVLVSTEAASLLSLLNGPTIFVFWISVTIISFYIWWKFTDRNWMPKINIRMLFRFPVVFIFIATVTTLMIALFAYPNNWDSMTYHLSRVMHWIQNSNVNHYSTHIERQVSQPPLAEYFILHFYLLSGIDRFANLVQWFFMSGTLAVVWLIAKELKADRNVATLAVLFAALLPMGILQSSSTQNDYVIGFFIGSSVMFLLRVIKQGFSLYTVIFFSLSVSLACMAKGTAYIFLLPVIVVYGIYALLNLRWKIYIPICIGILFYTGMNGAFVLRNYQSFGHPLAVDNTLQNDVIGVQALLSNTFKNTAMHVLTSFENLNKIVTRSVEVVHQIIRTDINDNRYNWQFSPTFSSAKSITHEDYAGNPLHVILLVIVFIWILLHYRKAPFLYFVYAATLIAMLCIFSILLKWQIWHFRLHLPLFIVASPLLAVCVGSWRLRIQNAIAVFFMLYASFFLFYNWSRPLIGKNSIFTNSMYDQYFFNQPESQRPFFDMSAIIQRTGMQNVGWVVTGDTWEYPMWVLLDDVKNLRMEHILVQNASAKWEDRDFIPDGIINKTIAPDSIGRIYYHGYAYQMVYENSPWMFMQRVE